MWWECSECGGCIERDRAPVLCRECGTAGVIFVQIDGDPDADSLREVWLRAGQEQAQWTLAT